MHTFYFALSPSTESEVTILYLLIINLYFGKLAHLPIVGLSSKYPLMLYSYGASLS